MIPIIADVNLKLDPTIKVKKGEEHLHCGHCNSELKYHHEETCSLFSYVVYQCDRCNKQFNHAKRFPRKVV